MGNWGVTAQISYGRDRIKELGGRSNLIKDDILDQKLRWASLGTWPSAKYSRQSESQMRKEPIGRCVKKWKLALCASGDHEDLLEQAPIVSSLGGESGSYPLRSATLQPQAALGMETQQWDPTFWGIS